MLAKIKQLQDDIFTQFWVVPLLLALTGLALSLILLSLDHIFISDMILIKFGNLFDATNARTLLSVVAAAVITITSVTFSLTILTLSIASNQLGPRLLPNFIRQKTAQFVLGFFIGTFIYALVVMQAIPSPDLANATPHLAILVGLALGISCFFLLIYFINYVCQIIQLDNVLSFLTMNIYNSIDTTLQNSNQSSSKKQARNSLLIKEQILKKSHKTVLSFDDTGYIQTIDYKKLLDIATDNGIIISIHMDCGKFTYNKLPIMIVYSNKALDDNIANSCLSTIERGKRRSNVQDIEFAFEQLSEIAIRAMSPGINSPHTAIHCLNHIAEGLQVLSTKQMLDNTLFDDKDKLRVIRKVVTFEDVVSIALDRLRQDAVKDLSISIKLLTIINDLLSTTKPKLLHATLCKQAKMIYDALKKSNVHPFDHEDVVQSYREIVATCKQRGIDANVLMESQHE